MQKNRVAHRIRHQGLLGMGVLATALLCNGCSRHANDAPRTGAAAPAHTGSGGGAPAAPAWAGVPLRGNDTAALRTYLRTVQEVKPKRFEVHWSPATVAIDKEAALRSLRAVSHDGVLYTFASSEPAVGRLKAGSILWVYDVCVRKVDSVEVSGDSTRVHTSEVKLTEAMPDAQIEFETPLNLAHYFPERHVFPPDASATARRQPRRAPGFVLVSLTGQDPPPASGGNSGDPADLPPENLPDPNAVDTSSEDDWYEEGITKNGYSGTKYGWAYSVGYQTREGGLTIELQGRKGDLEGGSESSSHDLIPEYKAIEDARQQMHDAIEKAKQELQEEEKGVRDTDQQFEQQMKQLQQDQANRKDPNYLGPSLPPQVNKYGEPITDKAAQQLLRDKWQKQHDLEIQKLQATEQILGEWRTKKDQLDARKRALKVARGVAAQLWQQIDDNFDARIRARVDLDGFAVGSSLGIVNSNIDVFATHFRNINGKAQLQLIGRLGKPGNEATKVPVMHVPVEFNVPIPVGGVPFVVQLGSDFLITLSLSGMHASLAVDGQAAFKGDSGLSYAKGKATYDQNFSSTGDPQITKTEGMSPGVSAVVLGIQMPRLGIGLGVWGVSTVAYVDVVNVITLTQSAAVGAGLMPLCKRATYNAVGHVGVETNIIPLPIVDTSAVAGALTGKKEIFNTSTKKLDPPVKACDL
ncbi:MAG: hypothetical protein JO341_06555 [Gammaproteobacteria bacterium]|nr:hypothetical protein [Gammaproteobacteria bacterium]MBV9620670.1 hypothetical protein [Gammaproteobacteria bacterium]